MLLRRRRLLLLLRCDAPILFAARQASSSGFGRKWAIGSTPDAAAAESSSAADPGKAKRSARVPGALRDAFAQLQQLWSDPSYRNSVRGKIEAKVAAYREEWRLAWKEGSAVEPPGYVKYKQQVAEDEQQLLKAGGGKMPHWHDDPTDLRRYGLKIGEIGSTRPRYDTIDGDVRRQTHAWDHTQAGLERSVKRHLGRAPWERK